MKIRSWQRKDFKIKYNSPNGVYAHIKAEDNVLVKRSIIKWAIVNIEYCIKYNVQSYYACNRHAYTCSVVDDLLMIRVLYKELKRINPMLVEEFDYKNFRYYEKQLFKEVK